MLYAMSFLLKTGTLIGKEFDRDLLSLSFFLLDQSEWNASFEKIQSNLT
jgi:hypothetical protein